MCCPVPSRYSLYLVSSDSELFVVNYWFICQSACPDDWVLTVSLELGGAILPAWFFQFGSSLVLNQLLWSFCVFINLKVSILISTKRLAKFLMGMWPNVSVTQGKVGRTDFTTILIVPGCERGMSFSSLIPPCHPLPDFHGVFLLRSYIYIFFC